MAYSLKCGDVVSGCSHEMNGRDEEEILTMAAQHAKEAHGLSDLDEETLAKVRSAIVAG